MSAEKEAARFEEFTRDYVEQLEEKDAELDRACWLLLNIEGALLAYWTDIPQHVIQGFLPRIREFLGDWEPQAATPTSDDPGRTPKAGERA